MKQIILFAFLLLISCSSADKHEELPADTEPQQGFVVDDNELITVALKFANTYIEQSYSSMEDIEQWIDSTNMTTASFNTEYKKIVHKAWEEDPEMGLGFDPIIDGQDFPDEGYELDHIDGESGYVFLIGKNEGYRLTLRIVKEGDKWLVDGAGIINIPEKEEE